ncbi:four-carbon acid sugar kinase family protein [Methylobacterium organophilum]|nr:four-carbon acid sugar kinase family protein [Methylobacterium organophilum]
MSLALGCVADDYTGASDLANTLTKAGLRTIQTIGVPEAGRALPEADAVVVALKSRSIPADQAVARSREAERWLRARGAAHVMFKVCSTFDSTDAGNIGPVMDALRADAGETVALVTPAFPETGRSVYQGNLFVGSVPLNESPLKDHPLNPMRDANLVRVLGRQSGSPVGLIDTATVARGAEAVAARLDALAQEGKGAAIADAIFDSDLEVLGRAILDRKFSVGASGLGLGLARALAADGRGTRDAAGAAVGEPVGGASACLAGSCSQATLQQVAAAEAIMPVLRLDPARLLAGDEALGDRRQRRLDGVAGRVDAVGGLECAHRFGRGRGGDQHRAGGQALFREGQGLRHHVVARGVRRLVVAGGETSGAVVDRLGLTAFLLGPEIAAGVPVLRTAGRPEPMLLALKSGNFGGADFFGRALDMMA